MAILPAIRREAFTRFTLQRTNEEASLLLTSCVFALYFVFVLRLAVLVLLALS